MLNKVTCGNCLDLMRELPDNYISSIITDPPYGLSNHSTEDVSECLACWIKGEPYTQSKKGFMGKAWDGWVPGPEVWKECYRVLKPGGTILCFAGSRTQDLMGMALRLSGFEIFDAIVYHFGSGFPKSHNISKALDARAGAEREVVGVNQYAARRPHKEYEHSQNWGSTLGGSDTTIVTAPATELAKQFDGYGTALKPSYEIILMGRKPCDGTFAQNAEKWGIAGLNIDGGRIGTDIVGWGGAKGFENTHNAAAQGGLGAGEANPTQGRWPANTILSCACDGEHAEDCPVRIMDEQSGVSKSQGGRINKKSDSSVNCVPSGNSKAGDPGYGDTGGASRFFYCCKPSKSEKSQGLDAPCTHPTVKPISLLRYLCKLTRPPHGGIVLDPFSGSGTTGIAAILEGRDFIGFELSQEYTEIANARIEHHAKQEDLCLSI